MKKDLYTLNIGNYEPEITAITFPLLKSYAKKIGADFKVITERKFPDFPIPYEKFQIYDLAKKSGAEWNLFFDADTLCYPDFFDVTTLVTKDVTIAHGSDFSIQRFKPNEYFKRDGRFQGKGNWAGIFSDLCLDYYHPLDCFTKDEAIAQITPVVQEKNSGVSAEHLLDDFTVSLNIARYGLKHILIPELETSRNMPHGHLYHVYSMSSEEKLIRIKKVLLGWVLTSLVGSVPTQEQLQAVTNTANAWNGTPSLKDYISVLPQGDRILEVYAAWGVPV